MSNEKFNTVYDIDRLNRVFEVPIVPGARSISAAAPQLPTTELIYHYRRARQDPVYFDKLVDSIRRNIHDWRRLLSGMRAENIAAVVSIEADLLTLIASRMPRHIERHATNGTSAYRIDGAILLPMEVTQNEQSSIIFTISIKGAQPCLLT